MIFCLCCCLWLFLSHTYYSRMLHTCTMYISLSWWFRSPQFTSIAIYRYKDFHSSSCVCVRCVKCIRKSCKPCFCQRTSTSTLNKTIKERLYFRWDMPNSFPHIKNSLDYTLSDCRMHLAFELYETAAVVTTAVAGAISSFMTMCLVSLPCDLNARQLYRLRIVIKLG